MRRFERLVLLLVLALGCAGPALASPASDWQRTPESAVRLISAVTGVADLERVPLGIEFTLAPGWKTYWRSPGDGGLAPELDWSGSRNLAGAELSWPAPQRFSILGIDSIGYAERVVLPIAGRPERPGEPLRLDLQLDYLTCSDICVPQQARLALDLPAGPAAPSAFAHLIDSFRGRVPGPAGPALTIERAELVGTGESARLRLTTSAALPPGSDAFIETESGIAFGRPRAEPAALSLPITAAGDEPAALLGTEAVVTLVAGGGAIEQRVTIAPGTAPAGVGLAGILAVALLGGLILNLMPCVLPVLSIKLLGVVGYGGAAPAAARRSFVATAAGIVTSFLLLAGGLIALKAGGAAIGWGIQFQQPWFLAAMTTVLLLFAANLWGFFEVRLPGWAGGLASAGSGNLAGAFGTGMLATLLATPCSAPFVGTAVGFALARGPGEILAVFLVLGLGLALPYLAVAMAPRIATSLPRPGPWMARLRQILGLLLLGTALWLLSVLATQAGVPAALAVAALGCVIVLILWRGGTLLRRGRGAAVAALAALAVAAPAALYSAAPFQAGGDPNWAAFDEERIAALVRDGRSVFVDVTADWCITCQVNKAAVLRRAPVADRLVSSEVVAMRADWTRPDEGIARYLARFGRYGIPFNAVYGPGAPAGIALPELLTSAAVLDALGRAAETRQARVD